MKKIIAALAISLMGMSGAAQAEYPERPVLLMIPYGAGGATDFQARIATIPAANEDMLGMPVAIINKPGAGGRVGWNWFANEAENDGYTLGATTYLTSLRNQLKVVLTTQQTALSQSQTGVLILRFSLLQKTAHLIQWPTLLHSQKKIQAN